MARQLFANEKPPVRADAYQYVEKGQAERDLVQREGGPPRA